MLQGDLDRRHGTSGDNATRRLQDTLERDVTDRFCRCQTNDVGLKIAQNAIVEAIDQPMHGQLTAVPPRLSQQCVPAKVTNLQNDVDLAELFHPSGRIFDGFDLLTEGFKGFGDRRQPVIDEPDGISSERGLNPTTPVVPANDDVEHLDSIRPSPGAEIG